VQRGIGVALERRRLIAHVAADLRCTETLRQRPRQAEADNGAPEMLTSKQREQIKALRRENYDVDEVAPSRRSSDSGQIPLLTARHSTFCDLRFATRMTSDITTSRSSTILLNLIRGDDAHGGVSTTSLRGTTLSISRRGGR
jgi:hypothetical protein